MDQKEINELLNAKETFRYQLLSRMQSDCNYYLGNDHRNPNDLWAGNEADHIKIMKALYESFAEDRKPEWCSMEQISTYEKNMVQEQMEQIQKPVRRSRGR